MSNMKDFTKKAFVIGAVAVIAILLIISIVTGIAFIINENNITEINAERYDVYDGSLYQGNQRKNLKTLKVMVGKLKKDVNSMDEYGIRGVHQAAINNNLKALEYLIKNKADINVMDENLTTPLKYAIENTNAKMVEVLLKNGADINLNLYNDEPDHSTLALAIMLGDINIVKMLLAKTEDINKINPDVNPLMYAVIYNRADILKEILNTFTNANINIKNEDITPLALAVKDLDSEIVDILLEKKASVINATANNENLLYNALLSYDTKLSFEENTNTYNELRNKVTQIINSLLKNGGEEIVNKKSEEYSLTPIFISSMLGLTEVSEALIKHKANVNIKDDYGNTPLIYAVLSYFMYEENDSENDIKSNILNSINLLLESKAIPNVEVGNRTIFEYTPSGLSPLSIAVYKNQLDITKLLIKYGANLTVLTKEGDTLLEHAMANNNIDMVQVLVESGFDLNTSGLSSNTPLMIASSENIENIVKIFLTKNVDINAKNRNGYTALHFASENGHKEIVKLLVGKKADVNTKNKDGNTPLHFAVENGNIETVNELVTAKADVNIENNFGDTVFDIAETKQNKDLLLEVLMKSSTFSN